MARQYLVPGYGYINETATRQFIVPGYGYTNETVAADAVAIAPKPTVIMQAVNRAATY